jgi:hypothetical protein
MKAARQMGGDNLCSFLPGLHFSSHYFSGFVPNFGLCDNQNEYAYEQWVRFVTGTTYPNNERHVVTYFPCGENQFCVCGHTR